MSGFSNYENNDKKQFELFKLRLEKFNESAELEKSPELKKFLRIFDMDSNGKIDTPQEARSLFVRLSEYAGEDGKPDDSEIQRWIDSETNLEMNETEKSNLLTQAKDFFSGLINAGSADAIGKIVSHDEEGNLVITSRDLDNNQIVQIISEDENSKKITIKKNGEIIEKNEYFFNADKTELLSEKVTTYDETGNEVVTTTDYKSRKPSKKITEAGGNVIKIVNFDYMPDGNSLITTITKDEEGNVIEQIFKGNEVFLAKYNTSDMSNYKNSEVLADVAKIGNQIYVSEYDEEGNTKIVVQNSETPALIAQRFKISLQELLDANKSYNKGRGMTKNTVLQAGEIILVPGRIPPGDERTKNRKTSEEVKRVQTIHMQRETQERLYSSVLNDYEITQDTAGENVYKFAEKYLLKNGNKKTDSGFRNKVNDLANELIMLNGKDAEYTKGSKIKLKNTDNELSASVIKELKEAGFPPNKENNILYVRMHLLTTNQQQNVIDVLKYCKSKGITDRSKINEIILKCYPELQMFETDTNKLKTPTKATSRRYIAHYLLAQISQVREMLWQTLNSGEFGTSVATGLHDIGHGIATGINAVGDFVGLTSGGEIVPAGTSTEQMMKDIDELYQKCLNLVTIADAEENHKDDNFSTKSRTYNIYEKQFEEKYSQLGLGKLNYNDIENYLKKLQDFNESHPNASESDVETALSKEHAKLNLFDTTNIEKFCNFERGFGGLLQLGFDVALLYASGGCSLIQQSAMKSMTATRTVMNGALERSAARKIGSKLLTDGVKFTTREGLALANYMMVSSAETAAFFQIGHVLNMVSDGKVTTEELAGIAEGYESLFKFSMVGSALAGPVGSKASELVYKLFNSEKAIASTIKLAVGDKGTTLDVILKALSEKSEGIAKVVQSGTSFSINSGYMALSDGMTYGDAMFNLGQMDAVSKLVVAMLGGKHGVAITPQKAQQIKTSLKGYEVKMTAYKGQKIYEVTDKEGNTARLANEQELFLFILDKEVAELQKGGEIAALSESQEKVTPQGMNAEEDALIQQARKENPATVIEDKVRQKWQQHDLETPTPETDEPAIIFKDRKAVINEDLARRQLEEPVQEISDEVTSLIFKWKLNEHLTQRYEEMGKVFEEIAKKHSADIKELVKQNPKNKQAVADGIIRILAKELGMEGFEPPIVFEDTNGADGYADWPNGRIVINKNITNVKQLTQMISHEFVHMLQYRDVLAQYGEQGLRDLIANDKSIPENEIESHIQKALANPYNQHLLQSYNFQIVQEGTVEYYLRRIYKDEFTNTVGTENMPGYVNQATEREAYHLGSEKLGENTEALRDAQVEPNTLQERMARMRAQLKEGQDASVNEVPTKTVSTEGYEINEYGEIVRNQVPTEKITDATATSEINNEVNIPARQMMSDIETN